MEDQGKRIQENEPKAEKDDRKSDRTRQKNKRGEKEQWDQTVSPEIPDREVRRHQKSPASLGEKNDKGSTVKGELIKDER